MNASKGHNLVNRAMNLVKSRADGCCTPDLERERQFAEGGSPPSHDTIRARAAACTRGQYASGSCWASIHCTCGDPQRQSDWKGVHGFSCSEWGGAPSANLDACDDQLPHIYDERLV